MDQTILNSQKKNEYWGYCGFFSLFKNFKLQKLKNNLKKYNGPARKQAQQGLARTPGLAAVVGDRCEKFRPARHGMAQPECKATPI